MTVVATSTLHVTKGHGTQNDFVLLDDRDALVDLSAVLVRELADRRAGVGGDGVIRVVASEHLPEGVAALAEEPGARWFMDYRNADGSVAEMCGNGVRVFAAFLERLGLWDAADGELALGTRAGVRRVRRVPVPAGVGDDVWYAVDMGRWHLPGGDAGRARRRRRGGRSSPGSRSPAPGLSVDVGNPHVVLALGDEDELAAADLTRAPQVTPGAAARHQRRARRPAGRARGAGRVAGRPASGMRVHERGVGETRSCGTGACAAALAVRTWAGAGAPDVWLVDVPGGTVRVSVLPDGHVELAGPAVLVAAADVDLAALVAGR